MKLLCVDSNSIINRAFYGIKLLSNKDGVYTNAVYGFFTILKKLLDETNPDAVVCAFDLRAPTFRHLKYEAYKAGRHGMPDELASQIPIVKELLRCMGYSVVEREGFEADDILGSMSKLMSGSGGQCYIATGDRDSLQLVRQDVTVLLATTKMGKPVSTVCTPEYIMEQYGVTPPELIEVKAIMGDTSDNIPGVAGIGEKGALKLISEFKTLDGVYENISSKSIAPKMREKLEAGKQTAYLSRELAEINCDIPELGPAERYKIGVGEPEKAKALLTKLQMHSLVGRFGLDGAASCEPSIGAEKAEAALPPVALFSGGIENFLASLGEGTVPSVVACLSEDVPTGLAVFGGSSVAVFRKDEAQAAAIKLFKSGRRLRTFGVKGFWRFLLINGVDEADIVFDLELAAYLLSPNSKDYTAERLLDEYEVTAARADSDDPLANEAVAVGALCDSLLGRIEEAGLLKVLLEIELPLAKVLASMELCGFSVNAGGIKEFGEGIKRDLERLEGEIYEGAGERFNINSPKQLGEVLFERLMLPSRRKTKSGYSTDAEVLESLYDYHPIIPMILEYRKLSKLMGTYVEGLLKTVSEDGRIHTVFRQTETRTGRISSIEPNLQNIPVRTELGSQLRKYFVANGGSVLVDADYSQIELRVLAHIANDPVMIGAFLSGEDIHTTTAAQVFDLPPLMVTAEMRSRAKAVNFGIVYGIGAFSLGKDIGVSVAEADRYIKNYLSKYSGVAAYMDKTVKEAEKNGYVTTMFGRRRYLPELRSQNKNLQAFGKRVAMNMPIQGAAADIIKIAMIRVYNRLKAEGLKSRLILQVHDELIVESPSSESAQAGIILCQEMEAAAKLKAPLRVDMNTGDNWYDAK